MIAAIDHIQTIVNAGMAMGFFGCLYLIHWFVEWLPKYLADRHNRRGKS